MQGQPPVSDQASHVAEFVLQQHPQIKRWARNAVIKTVRQTLRRGIVSKSTLLTYAVSGQGWWADSARQGADRVESSRFAFFLCHCFVLPHGPPVLSTLLQTAGITPINKKKTSCFACVPLTVRDSAVGFQLSREKSKSNAVATHFINMCNCHLFQGKENLKKRSGVGVQEEAS